MDSQITDIAGVTVTAIELIPPQDNDNQILRFKGFDKNDKLCAILYVVYNDR